jgi:Zn-dependent protease
MPNVLYIASTWIIPIILAITLHEAAHAFVARFLGDDTASRLGRVSLNPFKHIDLMGTILLPGFSCWRGLHLFSGTPSPCRSSLLLYTTRAETWFG